MRPPTIAVVFSLLALPSGDLVGAFSLPSSSSSTPRSALAPVVGDEIHIDVDSPPRTDGGTDESGRKWRAARRQMLRRVFMLLSTPGDDDRERVVRAERVAGTKVNGNKKRGVGSTASTPVVAKAVKVRRPTTGNGNGVLSSGLGQRTGHQTLNGASLPNGEGVKNTENDVNIGNFTY